MEEIDRSRWETEDRSVNTGKTREEAEAEAARLQSGQGA